MSRGIGEDFLEQRAILEIHGHVNKARQIGCIEVKLLQQGWQEFRRVKFIEIFPVDIAAVDHSSAAQVEEIDRNLRRFGVPGENIGVVALRSGDFLALFHISEGAKKIAITGASS